MFNSDMQEVEITIEDAKQQIHLGEVVKRLEKNDDFIELVLEGYFKEEASRIVLLKADGEHQSKERQEKLERDLLGIASFAEFLRNRKLLGSMAAESLKEYEATREEILNEEVVNG